MDRIKTLGAIAAVALAAGCTATSTTPTADTAAASAQAAREAQQAHHATHYLRQNFRGTTWLPLVKRIKVRDGEMYVTTAIYPDSDATEPAHSICSALRFIPHIPNTIHVVSTTGKWIGC